MTNYIAIDGRSGAGKSYLANILAEQLSATVFHLDNYGDDYHPFIGIPKLLSSLKETKDPLVIYEGVGVLDDRFNQFNAYRILVSVPEPLRKDRMAKRDAPTAERSAEDWQKIFSVWAEAEEEYFNELSLDAVHLVMEQQESDFDTEVLVDTIKNHFQLQI